MRTIRLTMAQTLVRYLTMQKILIEGLEEPLFPGVYAIFGAFSRFPEMEFIDFENFAKVLAEIDYSGWAFQSFSCRITSLPQAEQGSGKGPNPLEYSRMGYQHLSNVLHEAGLEISS